MNILNANEIATVGGALTADQGATLELAVAGAAAIVGSGGLGLLAIAAAGVCYEIGDSSK